MYSDEELDDAVKKGIFTEAAVAEFRAQLSSSKNTTAVDEEYFRLITGFNDIFVVIACSLLLFSSLWALNSVNGVLALFIFPLLAWGLAEFFVRKRKMALPAIVLLLAFVGGVFSFSLSLFQSFSGTNLLIASALSAIAAYFHWRRFKVPITVAAGSAVTLVFLVTLILFVFPDSKDWFLVIVFICGIIAFGIAMYWDSSDRNRTTRRSDIAFWLHLLSAPLIVHPVFYHLGILDGQESLSSMVIILFLYLLMTLISIAVDRRAFMVSSLAYVLYALSNILNVYGAVGYSFAVTGVAIGSALLLLSAYWHSSREKLVKILPLSIQKMVPAINKV